MAPSSSPFLTINDEPIYFTEDWEMGIGGGLWSTGLAMAKYFELLQSSKQIDDNLERSFALVGNQRLDVLELGSGNGFLSVCLLALLKGKIGNLVTTDLADHLPLIERTVHSNSHLIEVPTTGASAIVEKWTVMEHKWGHFSQETQRCDDSIESKVKCGNHKFHLIVGSDVAYHPDLYDCLIQSLLQFSNSSTIILLGITMKDTTPAFFHKLGQNGFHYDRLADHLLPLEFRGNIFGIFVLTKIRE